MVALTYSFGSGTNFDKLFAAQLQTDLTQLSGSFPTSSTDNAVARFDGTTGALQDSAFIIDDTGHVSSFGGNIKFPATQAASADANTLDDYEEGTWTPELTFATPGDLAKTYAVLAADYEKIGRQVRAHFLIVTSAFTWTTASGALQITGLPFPVANAGLSYTVACFIQGMTKAGYTWVNGIFAVNTSQITFFASASALAISNVVAADMPTGGTVIVAGGGTYRAA